MFTPEATLAEVAAIYQGALIEPLPDSPRSSATPREAAELRELVALILPDADDNERAYALRVALADPEAALTSFRVLAADRRPKTAPLVPDDRRTCGQRANLDQQRGCDGFQRCAAARRGELLIAVGRVYSPVPDVPKRCEEFASMPEDADRRMGRERWPSLLEGAR